MRCVRSWTSYSTILIKNKNSTLTIQSNPQSLITWNYSYQIDYKKLEQLALTLKGADTKKRVISGVINVQ